MKSPTVYTLDGLLDRLKDPSISSQGRDGKWYPCRPSGFHSIGYRARAVWLVLTGRADAFTWPGEQ